MVRSDRARRVPIVLALLFGCRTVEKEQPPAPVVVVAVEASAPPPPIVVTLPPAKQLVAPFRGTKAHGFVAITVKSSHAIVPIVDGEPVDSKTPVLIASFTKLFTAVAALRMAARGEITLDLTIKEALPALAKRPWSSATVRELLGHVSQVPEFDESRGYYRKSDVDLSDPVGAIHDWVPADWTEKRGIYKYRNAELAVVGAILATRAQKTEEEVLAREVFEPAGMKSAGLLGAKKPATLDMSPMGGIRPQNFFAAGAGYASADDLLAFFDALDGTALLDEASKKILFEGDAAHGYASLGSWFYTFESKRMLERPGSLGNVRLFTAYFPDEHRAIVAWTPSGIDLPRPRASPKGVGAMLARAALE
jgi:CubicO group peptidase (beta-lactamase class C family)